MWGDRLAEVWSPPGRAGAGVVVGERGVLTARHVVEAASAGANNRPLARVVRPGVAVGEWVPMTIEWSDADWDVALLSVDSAAEERQRWLVPRSDSVVVVA